MRYIVSLLLLISMPAFAERHVELILDASGSMWNKLDDGRFRIVAAKDVLADIISGLPSDNELNVGLRIYGATMDAQEDGSCEDTKLFVPIDGVDRAKLLDTVQRTQARGATPIVLSLLKAVEDLPKDGNNMIILVTDGEEGCDGDLALTWEEIQASGVDIDLRIIGIDLSDEAAATFDGIGTFENAQTAAELSAALGEAIEMEDTTVPVSAKVTRDGEPVDKEALVAFVSPIDNQRYVFSSGEPGMFGQDLEPGVYTAEIKDAFAEKPLQFSDLNVSPDGENAFEFELQPEVVVELSVEPTDPVAGSAVTITYAGAPKNDRSWITLVPIDMADKTSLGTENAPLAEGEVTLRSPDEPTTLEARFHLPMPRGGSRIIGRSEPFESTKPLAEVTGPEEVGAGSAFQVEWKGPNNTNDYLVVREATADAAGAGPQAYAHKGSPSELRAPDKPGEYAVHYMTGQTRMSLASAKITVTPVTASVKPPAEVNAGAEFTIEWEGPDNKNDFITLVEADAKDRAYGRVSYSSKGSPATLLAPDEPGDYEVRYLTGQTRTTLASAPIKVLPVTASVKVPESVIAGAEIEIEWTGAANKNDFITVVAPDAASGKYGRVAYAAKGSPAKLETPDIPGTYEARYMSGQSREVLARATFEALAPEVSLAPPATAKADEKISIEFVGPKNKSDFITIVEVGAAEKAYGRVTYAAKGSPATIQAPAEPGSYEVRYLTGQSRRTLATAPITITAE